MTLRKNVASQKLVFTLVNATTGAALTGATVTAKLSIDGGASATATGAVAELANGQYAWSPDAADTNGTVLGVQFTATNAVPRAFTVYTVNYDTTAATVPANTTHFGGTAGTFAAGIPETKVASVAAGAITAAAIATDAIDADALAADAVTEIADGIIARNIAGGSSTGRTVGHALAAIRNKSAITAIDETAGTATLTVYDTDDTSVLFTAAISLTTLTKSITAMDPA